MAKFYLMLASSVLMVLLSGCGSIGNLYTFKGIGVLYTHKVEPLTTITLLSKLPKRIKIHQAIQPNCNFGM